MDKEQVRLECLEVAERDASVSGTADLMRQAAACEAWVQSGKADQAQARLSCLRLAARRRGSRDPRDLLSIAEDVYNFCVDGLPAPKPIPEPEAAPPAPEVEKPGTPAKSAPPAGTTGRRGRRRAKA